MSAKRAAKYGTDGMGQWQRDEHGSPAYDLDLRTLSGSETVCTHPLSTTALRASCAPAGTIQVIAGDALDAIQLPPKRAAAWASALRLELCLNDDPITLLPALPPVAWKPVMRLGNGYVTYAMDVNHALLPAPLRVRVQLLACPNQPYLLADITLQLGKTRGLEALTCELNALCDAREEASFDQADTAVFSREGMAIVSLGDKAPDAFLAGSSGWDSRHVGRHLALTRRLMLEPEQPIALRLILGCTPACSVQWIRKQFQGLTTDGIRNRVATRRRTDMPTAPQLWMREDLEWCRCMLTGCAVPDPHTRRTIAWPWFDGRPARMAHLAILAAMLARTEPELALDTMRAVSARQGPQGQLPERMDLQPGGPGINPATTRSDTEIWFLWAWSTILETTESTDLLRKPIPDDNARAPVLLDRCLLTADWIRHAVGTGPHGLVRILAGDWNGLLDQMGTAGAGESVLNTALLCAALRSLAELCRLKQRIDTANNLEKWHRDLARAAGDAFSGNAFLRGYTDTANPVGDTADGPVFTDVQAWCVIARCGTVSQRRQALDTVLEASSDNLPPVLSKPLPRGWPKAVSSTSIPPGHGLNGGVSLIDAAWFAQALAIESRLPEALAIYEALCLRRRAAGKTAPHFPHLARAAVLNGPHAHRQSGWPTAQPQHKDSLPDTFAIAWQEPLMNMLTQGREAPANPDNQRTEKALENP